MRPFKGGSLVALSHPFVYLCRLTSGGNCRFRKLSLLSCQLLSAVGTLVTKLSPHFDAMSLVAQTPWKASLIYRGYYTVARRYLHIFIYIYSHTCISLWGSASI